MLPLDFWWEPWAFDDLLQETFLRKCTVNFYITRVLPQCALSRIVLLACLILALHIALFSTVT